MLGKSGKKKIVLQTLIILVATILTFSGLALYSTTFRAAFSSWIAESGVDIARDVSYGSRSRQKLDIYVPEEGDNTKPVVLFLYGGGWTSGRKEMYSFVGAAFARQGYTTVVPDYRLYPEVQFPVFIEDAAEAYAWTWNMFNKGKDVERPIIVIGHSAGAYLGAMISYNTEYLKRLDESIKRPSGFVGLAGPYSFDPTNWPSTKHIFSTAKKNADSARPLTFVNFDSPKTLLLHGTSDSTVRVWNAVNLQEKLTGHRVDSRLLHIDGIGHIGIVTALAAPLRWRAPVFRNILTFLKNIEKP